ncbi:MAG: glycosyltransferase family 2 protein [Candidatus Sumerlaeia bacterium]|nr:glycosyltransferase family 2 protein [Candidatus Sumerlaeia bacterium]
MSRFSIIIVSLNGKHRLDLPLGRLFATKTPPHEVIVVDNGSTDGTSDHIRSQWPQVKLIRSPRNLGFAGGNNLGISEATGEVLVLLNDDTEPEPGWLEALEEAFYRNPRLGIGGCQLIYPGDGGRVQHLGGIVHLNGLTDHIGWGGEAIGDHPPVIPGDYVTGAAMAIRREVMMEIGLLDPGFWPIYFEEVDYCFRARRRGWESATVTASKVIHHESQTTGRMSRGFLEKYHRNRVRFLLKNRSLMQWPATIRAELRWLVANRPWNDLVPCAKAWAWAPVHVLDLALAARREEPRRRKIP